MKSSSELKKRGREREREKKERGGVCGADERENWIGKEGMREERKEYKANALRAACSVKTAALKNIHAM